MAVSPRIHWVNLSFLAVLDVLPRRPAQAQADHPVVGLHPRSDGAECAVVAGGNPWDEVRGLNVAFVDTLSQIKPSVGASRLEVSL